MDIGIANSENSTDFHTLAVVTDSYVHRQDYQQNFTAVVVSRTFFFEHLINLCAIYIISGRCIYQYKKNQN